jgi:uncharacterized RDD family membrane protein YckC
MFCSKCGANVPDTATFCSACGQPIGSLAAASIVSVAVQPAVQYAGFWLRFVATIIDGLLLGIPMVFVVVLIAGAMGVTRALEGVRPDQNPGAVFAMLGVSFILAIFAVSIVGGWLYFALLESSPWQGTLGKKALGLYVSDLQGSRITFGRATGRYLGGRFIGHLPGAGGLYFIVDCICAGFTERKQALHDMIAGCLVLRKI